MKISLIIISVLLLYVLYVSNLSVQTIVILGGFLTGVIGLSLGGVFERIIERVMRWVR